MTYNDATGWTKLLNRQVHRYMRSVDGRPDDVDERLEAAGLDYFWDAYGGLHVRCTSGEIWELLSGQPATFGNEPASVPTEEEWINVTDLGAVIEPPAPPPTVLKWLRSEGLIEKVGRKDVPTAAAAGLYREQPVDDPASGFPVREGAVHRQWSYQVLVRLRARSAEFEAECQAKIAAEAQRPVPTHAAKRITVKFPCECAQCEQQIEPGAIGHWNRATKAVTCESCATDTGMAY